MEYSARIHDKWLSVYREQNETTTPQFAISQTVFSQSSLVVEGHTLVILGGFSSRTVLYTASSEDDARAILSAILTVCAERQALKSRRLKVAVCLAAFMGLVFLGGKILNTLSDTPSPEYHAVDTVLPPPPMPERIETQTPHHRPEPTANVHPDTTRSIAAAPDARLMLAQNLRNAAARQQFTISLSTGHERTLYVFVDPECHNCQIFEPAVQSLSQYFNIEVFPVTLIGKEVTAREVVPVLCAPAGARPVLWRNLFDMGAGMLSLGKDNNENIPQPAACETGAEALALNDKAFAVYHLPGTPAVIADDGRQVPFTAMKNLATLNTFLTQR